MPELKVTILLGGHIETQKTFFQYKVSMKLLKNTVGDGYNLSDDRSHKVQSRVL